jgi:glycosyltransferase involved in cell wall biosynthesis
LRIALIHYAAPPVVGGVESVLAQQARLMARAGHTVSVIVGRGEAEAAGVPLVCLPLLDSRHPEVLAVKAALDEGRVPAEFARLQDAILADLRPALAGVEVVFAHNVCSLNKNLALTAALRILSQEPGAPGFILWHHDLAWATDRYRAELHDGYPWDLLRTDWPGTQPVSVSEARRQELATLLKIPAGRIEVVPNGVSRALLLKLEDQTQALLAQMDLAAAEPLLLLPARLTPRKNIELALRVLAELRRLRPQAALLVTGPEGPHNPANAGYRARLLALRDELGLRPGAHFAAELVREPLPDAVVADFLRLADALILPSREEGFGIPLIEAALTRLPVFCADIPPLRELGGEDVTYFALEAEPAAIARTIAGRLDADPVYQFAVRARQRYTWERMYADCLAPLLAHSSARRHKAPNS